MFCSIVYQLYKIDQEITLETSYLDGEEYFVLSHQTDSKQAANQLAEINQRSDGYFPIVVQIILPKKSSV